MKASCASRSRSKSIIDSSPNSRNAPKCHCNLHTSLKISRSERNPGKGYFNCSNWGLNGGCDFFKWADSEDSTSVQHSYGEVVERDLHQQTEQLLKEMQA